MSRKRSLKSQSRNMQMLEQTAIKGRTWDDGPKRKTWSLHDLKSIRPLNQSQAEMFHEFARGQSLCAIGSAGTGKTMISLYLALNQLLDPESGIDRITIVRSVVPTREVGHLPGTLEEKTAVYEVPYRDLLQELVGRVSTYDDMKEAGYIDFCTTSFIRGVTWDNTVVVVDECQNMTFHEINSIMTRVGKNSRILLAGDVRQTDLNKKGDDSGLKRALQVVGAMDEFSTIEFTRDDIVRSDFVKSWIIASEDVESGSVETKNSTLRERHHVSALERK